MKFEQIRQRAEARKGGPEALEALLAEGSRPDAALALLADDRILAELTKRVFQAGFNWQVIENKWPGFEKAFHGFDLARNAMMSDGNLDRHLKNTEIVRNGAKILSVRDNAIFLSDLAAEHGSAAKFLADWPASDLVGLWDVLKKRGCRLGGASGQYALRFLGKDSFMLSGSVISALKQAGVIDGPATSKTAHRKIQAAFNAWAGESGESYTRMSRILAMSTD